MRLVDQEQLTVSSDHWRLDHGESCAVHQSGLVLTFSPDVEVWRTRVFAWPEKPHERSLDWYQATIREGARLWSARRGGGLQIHLGLKLKVPEGQAWPVLGVSADRALLLNEDFVYAVARTSQIPVAFLTSPVLMRLLHEEYAKGRAMGMAPCPHMEALIHDTPVHGSIH